MSVDICNLNFPIVYGVVNSKSISVSMGTKVMQPDSKSSLIAGLADR